MQSTREHPVDCNHDNAMAELFQSDPVYAAFPLKEVMADGEPVELTIILCQIAKAFGATTANSADSSAEQ